MLLFMYICQSKFIPEFDVIWDYIALPLRVLKLIYVCSSTRYWLLKSSPDRKIFQYNIFHLKYLPKFEVNVSGCIEILYFNSFNNNISMVRNSWKSWLRFPAKLFGVRRDLFKMNLPSLTMWKCEIK